MAGEGGSIHSAAPGPEGFGGASVVGESAPPPPSAAPVAPWQPYAPPPPKRKVFGEKGSRRRKIVAVVVVLLVALAGLVTWRLLSLGAGGPTIPPTLVLNEVLFDPAPGDPSWIELKNGGTSAYDLRGLSLENETAVRYDLPSGIGPVAANALLLIRFDGQNRVEGSTVHADRAAFLSSAGNLTLRGTKGDLDWIAWGENQPDSVKLTRGGEVDPLSPGSTIGRIPQSIAPARRLDWVLYSSGEATPGGRNPYPAVAVLAPFDGAQLDGTNASLAWYAVPHAVHYRVQIATDAQFAQKMVDINAPYSTYTAGPLSPSTYYWRVQAAFDDGSAAEFSPANAFNLTGTRGTANAPLAHLLTNVPLLLQRKDTSLLLLEERDETGDHAWDRPHREGSYTGDPAEEDCAIASIVIIDHAFGGALSQDRVGYEIFKDRLPGPERDFQYGDGTYPLEEKRGLEFALGTTVTMVLDPDVNRFWTSVVSSIDAGLPVFLGYRQRPPGGGHAVVVMGYDVVGTQRTFYAHDPATGNGARGTPESMQGRIDVYFLLPPVSQIHARSDEASVHTDSDGDGIMDFDETNRFDTDPLNRDTDGDQVPDKADVRASIFDSRYGYSVLYNSFTPFPQPNDPHRLIGLDASLRVGRDFDHDGIPMELDRDADNGGCVDGKEDKNLNGVYESGVDESYNFDPSDDYRCIPEGAGTVSSSESWNYTDAGISYGGLETALADIQQSRVEPSSAHPGTFLSFNVSGSLHWTYDETIVDPSGPTTERRTADCTVSMAGWIAFANATALGFSANASEGSLMVVFELLQAPSASCPMTDATTSGGSTYTITIPAIAILSTEPWDLEGIGASQGAYPTCYIILYACADAVTRSYVLADFLGQAPSVSYRFALAYHLLRDYSLI